MRLYDFVNLPWDTTVGTDVECAKFIANSSFVATLVGEDVINLTEESLATIFKLGVGNSKDIAARARSWQSQKFQCQRIRMGISLLIARILAWWNAWNS
ncbi:unnamed protein product [Calypogeia fissa]